MADAGAFQGLQDVAFVPHALGLDAGHGEGLRLTTDGLSREHEAGAGPAQFELNEIGFQRQILSTSAGCDPGEAIGRLAGMDELGDFPACQIDFGYLVTSGT